MNIPRIINDLKSNKPKIIKELSDKEWRHFKLYYNIGERYKNNDFGKEFQRDFCNFYILNGAGGLNDIQKKEFFKILQSGNRDFKDILQKLYKIPGYKNSKRLFLSFATKLLHTIDNSLPIYDKNIGNILSLPKQKYSKNFEIKIENRKQIYQALKEDFKILLKDNDLKRYLVEMRKDLKNKTVIKGFKWEDKKISDVKLLDSSLWALYKVKK